MMDAKIIIFGLIHNSLPYFAKKCLNPDSDAKKPQIRKINVTNSKIYKVICDICARIIIILWHKQTFTSYNLSFNGIQLC